MMPVLGKSLTVGNKLVPGCPGVTGDMSRCVTLSICVTKWWSHQGGPGITELASGWDRGWGGGRAGHCWPIRGENWEHWPIRGPGWVTSAFTSLEQRGAVRVWPPTPLKPATAHKNWENARFVFLMVMIHTFLVLNVAKYERFNVFYYPRDCVQVLILLIPRLSPVSPPSLLLAR